MSFVAVAIGGAAVLGLGGAYMTSQSAKGAADTQAGAAKYAADLQNQQYQQQRTDQQPWMQAGAAALPQLSQMASQTPSFTAQDFLKNQDPAYQFDLQQGQQALERSAAARGGLQSGGTLKDLTTYAQGAASNEYQNAYSRFMNNQNTQFNRLASVAGIGQTANGQISAAGMNYANQAGEARMGGANAAGAAGIAGANAWSGALSGMGKTGMEGLMISRMPNYGANPYGGGAVSGTPGSAYDASQAPIQPYSSAPGTYSLLSGGG